MACSETVRQIVVSCNANCRYLRVPILHSVSGAILHYMQVIICVPQSYFGDHLDLSNAFTYTILFRSPL